MNLVFIHGAGSSSKVWTFQKRYFSRDHEVTLLTLSGHGGKKGEGKETINEYVEEVRTTIQEYEDVVIIGHSMGGAITMSYALQNPVTACVLAGTGAKLRVLPAILEQIKENYEQTIDFILEYAIYNKTEQIMHQSKKEMLATLPEIMHKDFIACDTFDVIQEIEHLHVPTLVVCGSEDVLSPVKYSQYLAAKIEHSTLEVIENCGHMLMLEKPVEFNHILDQFFNTLDE
ncbi:MAG: alpha/beta hydrolase [Theionarchaea archaeon]|nr:alpha/beta hydrolase [Theionarchaea archaeon]